MFELSIDYEDTNSFEDKDWTRSGGPIGPTQDHNSLKIENQEIKGSELRKLMKLLCYSRLAVNREGICFLDTMGLDNDAAAPAEFQQQYQMIRSRFDWSTFQLIKIGPGNSGDNCIIHPGNNGNNTELSVLEEKVADLERELEQRVFEMSGQSAEDFFYDIVSRTRVSFPSKNFDVGSSEARTEFTGALIKRSEILPIDEVLTPMDTKPNTSLFPRVPIQVSSGEFDSENWWVITVATRKSNGWETDVKPIIYYDHEVRSRRQRIGDRTIAVPFVVGSEFRYNNGFGLPGAGQT